MVNWKVLNNHQAPKNATLHSQQMVTSLFRNNGKKLIY